MSNPDDEQSKSNVKEIPKSTQCVFDTLEEKDHIYKTMKNPQLEEILFLLNQNEQLLHYTLLHKLNSKLKHLHILQKMKFGSQLI